MCSRFHFPTCAGSKVSSPISNTQSVQKVSESRSKFVGFFFYFFVCFLLILCRADAPWCGHCKQLEPVFAEAADKLKKGEPGVALAKVDATDEKELAEEFAVSSFPVLKLFVHGDRKNPIDFTGTHKKKMKKTQTVVA